MTINKPAWLKFTAGIILSIWMAGASGQSSYTAGFTIHGLSGQKVLLYSYYGDRQNKIDSAVTDERGFFSFIFPSGREPGIYRIATGKNQGMDFIFNRENADIRIDRQFTPDSAVVSGSVENRIMFEYLVKKIYFELRLQLLEPVVFYYPPDDPFYRDVKKQFDRLTGDYNDYLASVDREYPDLIVTRFIKFDQLEDIRPGETDPGRIAWLKGHYFDGIDLTDTVLLYSPLLPGRVIDYLSLFVVPGAGKEAQEGYFKDAVDSLMVFTVPGSEVREAIINYLIEGFQAYGLEDVLSYLVESYVLDRSCVSEQKEEVLRKRIEGFKKLAPGNPAPDFEAQDIDGRVVSLSLLQAPYKILFFWASDCPHCAEAVPGMKKIAAEYAGSAQIIAISVDQDEAAWRKAVEEKGMRTFTNIADLKGWDGKIVNDYYIYATPTILVLDKDLKIVAKPTGVRELEGEMQGLRGGK